MTRLALYLRSNCLKLQNISLQVLSHVRIVSLWCVAFADRQISAGDCFVMLPTTSMIEHSRTLPNGSILKFLTPTLHTFSRISGLVGSLRYLAISFKWSAEFRMGYPRSFIDNRREKTSSIRALSLLFNKSR